jgi:hypothetical protein
MATRTLTDLEQRILAFEGRWEGRSRELKGAAARVEFGWSHAAYEMRLQALLQVPAAAEAEPRLVKRALELREVRTLRRAARSFDRVAG